jgi:hypothetical protein
MRLPSLLLALLLTALPASARLGDTLAQTLYRYGQPIAATGKPGELTSTDTFAISGLQVTCGYVGGKVVMETLTNPDRDFLPAEVEAILRTEGQKKNWTPGGPFGPGTYTRVDGITATVTGNQVAVVAPAWTEALAQDAATEKANAARIAAGDTNAPPAEPAPTHVETSAATNPMQTEGHRPTAADINTTNAP